MSTMGKIIPLFKRDDHFERLERALRIAIQEEPSSKFSHLYFIQQGNKGPLKIGVSNNPYRRLGGLQTASPVRLRLLFFYKIRPTKVHEVEDRIHRCFKDDRLEGEWFFPSANLIDFICSEIKSQAERKSCVLNLNRGNLLQALLVSTLDQFSENSILS